MILQSLEVAKKCVVRNYADSGLHDTCSNVCILNFSVRLLEESSPLWHMVSASEPYFWLPHHA